MNILNKLISGGASKLVDSVGSVLDNVITTDEENSQKVFGRTAHYDPGEQTIVIFITNRHPKDILRSFCHELIHHVQNERGDLEMGDASSPTYAQDDEHMRKMEKEAYLEGNLLLRDHEDQFKK